jgi:ribose-phosphate pyrophosphokinase
MPQPIFQLFAGTATRHLAQQIAELTGHALGNLTLTRFKDGEIQPAFGESIRGHRVFLIQSTCPPADNLMELLLMVDAAKRASAESITVVIPYYGFARQDRKDKPRVAIGAKLVADLLEVAGATRVVTMDLHAGQIQGFFNIPVDNLEASSVFVEYIRGLGLTDLVIASPDMGGVVRARQYAAHLNADLALVDKRRVAANEVQSMQVIGDVTNRHVILVDDICDTANTLCKAAEIMLEKGAISVRAAVTHPILSDGAPERIEQSVLTEVLVTNTILKSVGGKIKTLSVAPIFATALNNIFNNESVSSLFLSNSK